MHMNRLFDRLDSLRCSPTPLLIAWLAVGCTPASEDVVQDTAPEGETTQDGQTEGPTGGQTDGQTDGQTEGETDGQAGDSSMTGADETGNESETGAGACEEEPADPAPVAVAMGVRNETEVPIFLHRGFECSDEVTLRGPGDENTALRPPCEKPACGGLFEGDCSVVCGDDEGDCSNRMVRIDPGATFVHDWDGLVWIERVLPVECIADCDPDPDCIEQVVATSGTYTFDVRVGECPYEDPGECECPGGDPTCSILVESDLGIQPGAAASLEFEFPDETDPILVVR